MLKDWLKIWAKTSKVGSDSSRKNFEGIPLHPENLLWFYTINYAFDFLGIDRVNKRGITVVKRER